MSYEVNPAHLVNLARALAHVVHSGQTRKDGGSATEHVERVAERVAVQRGIRAEIIALLHDTIEDTSVHDITLLDIGFPEDIVRDVYALTRETRETYAEFIERTIDDGSDDALYVKLADLQDNLKHPIQNLESRYRRAHDQIIAELLDRQRRRAA